MDHYYLPGFGYLFTKAERTQPNYSFSDAITFAQRRLRAAGCSLIPASDCKTLMQVFNTDKHISLEKCNRLADKLVSNYADN